MYEQYRTSNAGNTPDRLLACIGNLKVFLSGQLLESEDLFLQVKDNTV